MDKASRPVRNRRHNSRQAWLPGEIQHHHRMHKRLFTPEIKRMLKDWLVRRRENPYPSRDEKKRLAINTGLTYIQICNWFANWRRKLKNAGREPARKTWGHLIKSYNTSANGNVEQFSICSGDSIWGDDDRTSFAQNQNFAESDGHNSKFSPMLYNPRIHQPQYLNEHYDRLYVPNTPKNAISKEQNVFYAKPTSTDYNFHQNSKPLEQCFQISSTTQPVFPDHNNNSTSSPPTTSPPSPSKRTTSEAQLFSQVKYKKTIMEKYMRDFQPLPETTEANTNYYTSENTHLESSQSIARKGQNSPVMGGIELSKWLESAANFTPNKNNYIEWNSAERNKATLEKDHPSDSQPNHEPNHEREDLEAAEVLTSLAENYRNRMFSCSVNCVN